MLNTVTHPNQRPCLSPLSVCIDALKLTMSKPPLLFLPPPVRSSVYSHRCYSCHWQVLKESSAETLGPPAQRNREWHRAPRPSPWGSLAGLQKALRPPKTRLPGAPTARRTAWKPPAPQTSPPPPSRPVRKWRPAPRRAEGRPAEGQSCTNGALSSQHPPSSRLWVCRASQQACGLSNRRLETTAEATCTV